jgi:hypothetical protein
VDDYLGRFDFHLTRCGEVNMRRRCGRQINLEASIVAVAPDEKLAHN